MHMCAGEYILVYFPPFGGGQEKNMNKNREGKKGEKEEKREKRKKGVKREKWKIRERGKEKTEKIVILKTDKIICI